MKTISFLSLVFLVTTTTIPSRAEPVTLLTEADAWTKPVNGLRARIVLVEKPMINGTRQITPYLELSNASDVGHPMKVRCDREHVKFELVSGHGKVFRNGWMFPRSGPHADPGTIVLPLDSSIRISMHCTNWGVPKDAAAMISTDSGAWVLTREENGKVFLKVTIEGEKGKSKPERVWDGKLEATAKVD